MRMNKLLLLLSSSTLVGVSKKDMLMMTMMITQFVIPCHHDDPLLSYAHKFSFPEAVSLSCYKNRG